MTTHFVGQPLTDIEYPSEDGQPVAESDFQRDYLLYAVSALQLFFQDQPNVYASGNLFIYYEQGNPKAVVAPDVFVVLGVSNHPRMSYKLWEENDKAPDFVLEVTSKATVSEDQGVKKGLYAYLGVQEYFQYDPTGDYLDPQLRGFHLVAGNYLPLPVTRLPDGNSLILVSEVLGLELRLERGKFYFYDPKAGRSLLTYQEAEQARQQAEQRAEQESQKSKRLADKLRELGIDPESV